MTYYSVRMISLPGSMTPRTRNAGDLILLVLVAILSAATAQELIEVDYLKTTHPNTGYNSRPCMYSLYTPCPKPENCKPVNMTHFTCDCTVKVQHGHLTTGCLGSYPETCKPGFCANGQCVPSGGFSPTYRCKCRPGFFGKYCEKGPIKECSYLIGGVDLFTAYFRVRAFKTSELSGLKDMCHRKGLLLIKNPRDHCLLKYYSMASGVLGGGKSFVYLGYDSLLYVSTRQEFPISYPNDDGLSKLIAEQNVDGLHIIQICMRPPRLGSLYVLPQIATYNKVNVACEIVGLRPYMPFVNQLDVHNAVVSKALKKMSDAYFDGSTMYYGLQVEPDSPYQQYFKYTPGIPEVAVASIPSDAKHAVTICRDLDPCDMDPCGPNAYICAIQPWGFKCICKNGFTGPMCSVDMAEYRVTCGDYTMYTLANRAVFKEQVQSVGEVADICKHQYSTLPPEALSKCEKAFYRNISKRFFNSHSYMYYTRLHQEMVSVKNVPFALYAFTDRFNLHLQATVCHGSTSLLQLKTWTGMDTFKYGNRPRMDHCEYGLYAGCDGKRRFYG